VPFHRKRPAWLLQPPTISRHLADIVSPLRHTTPLPLWVISIFASCSTRPLKDATNEPIPAQQVATLSMSPI
jgi:hypothetical protein